MATPKATNSNAAPWMKFLPDGLRYPNIVIEVAINNESPDKLIDYANRYFSALSSVRIWIAVKVWLAEKEMLGWVGGEGTKLA